MAVAGGKDTVKRVLHSVAYGMTGLVLAAGAVYGWRQLTAPPPMPPVPPLAETAAPPPPVATAAAVQQVLAPAPPASSPAPVAPAYADTAQDVYAEDQARFYELQQACYQAAANNRNGEYPSFQAMACDRYAQFAASRGLEPGTLPAYGQAPDGPAEPVEQSAPQDQSQVVLLAPDYYGGYGNHHHHHRPQPLPDDNGRPQQQIGPNFTPPPPQAQPPVSQRQSSRAQRSRPQN